MPPDKRDGGPRQEAAAQVHTKTDADATAAGRRSAQLDALAEALDPLDLFCLLSVLPARHHLYLAARLAVELAEAKRTELRRLKAAARDVHGGECQAWAAVARRHLPHAELVRRRAQPGPMAPPAGGAV